MVCQGFAESGIGNINRTKTGGYNENGLTNCVFFVSQISLVLHIFYLQYYSIINIPMPPHDDEAIEGEESDNGDVEPSTPECARANTNKRPRLDNTTFESVSITGTFAPDSKYSPVDTASISELYPKGKYYDSTGLVLSQVWLDTVGKLFLPELEKRLKENGAFSVIDLVCMQLELAPTTGLFHVQGMLRAARQGNRRHKWSVSSLTNHLNDWLKPFNPLSHSEDFRINWHVSPSESGNGPTAKKSTVNLFQYCSYETYPENYWKSDLIGLPKRIPGTEAFIYNPTNSFATVCVALGVYGVLNLAREGKSDLDIIEHGNVSLNHVRSVMIVTALERASAASRVVSKCGDKFCKQRHNVETPRFQAMILGAYKVTNPRFVGDTASPEVQSVIAHYRKPCSMSVIYIWGSAGTGKTTDAGTLATAHNIQKGARINGFHPIQCGSNSFFGTVNDIPQIEGSCALVWNEINPACQMDVLKVTFECGTSTLNLKNGSATVFADLHICTSNYNPVAFFEELAGEGGTDEYNYQAFTRRFGTIMFFARGSDHAHYFTNRNLPVPFKIALTQQFPSFQDFWATYQNRMGCKRRSVPSCEWPQYELVTAPLESYSIWEERVDEADMIVSEANALRGL